MPNATAAAATASLKPVQEPAYDVAISFLVADEKIASAIKSGLAGLKVFFYPHNQEELVGTNGIESMREPFLAARVNVILFRERYGNTPWTGVELKAIQDSCLKTRFESLVFAQLDKADQKPLWLPDTHIRCVLGDFTLDQLVGAIKLRVQERGGEVTKVSPLELAKRLRAEELLRQDEKKFFRDDPYIKQTAAKVVDELMKELMAQVEHIKAEVGAQWTCGYESEGAGVRGVVKYGRVALEVWWRQIYTNVIEDVALECTEYNGGVVLRSENKIVLYEPERLAEKKYYPTLNMGREMRWIDKAKPEQLMSNGDVVEKVIEQFLSLVDRVDRGKIPAIRH
jgi:hypothetical protein